MSNFNIRPTRFVRQYTNGKRQDKINYVLIMQNLLGGLQNIEWSKSYASLDKIGFPNHDFAGGPYIDEAYDAYKISGQYNSSDMTYVGYAGCSVYRFAVPSSYYGHYSEGVTTIDAITVPISRDRFLKTGLKVHVVASDVDHPSSDWGIIGGERDASGNETTVYRSDALLSQNSVSYLVDSVPKSESITIDTSAKAQIISQKKYIYVYLTLNDYTDFWSKYNAKEARMYAIEGSAAMSPSDFVFSFTGNVTPDPDEEIAYASGSSLFKKIAGWGSGIAGAAAITIGALWYGGVDSDEDGMPDEWANSFEVLRAISDPAKRMSYSAQSDFMAYADFESGLVVASNTTTGVCAPFQYDPDDNRYINIGVTCSNLQVRTTFPYGDYLGVGTNTTLTTAWKVIGFSRNKNYRLCHFQVYQKFGYEPDVATANATKHTKAFTALDKYLLARLLMENGIGPGETNVASRAKNPAPYTTLVPGVIDYDGDYAPDGLELYMMFGPNAPSLSNNHLNPWDKSDGMSDYDGDGLTMTQEINGGVNVLNPWMIQSNYGGIIDKWADMYNIRRNSNSSLDDDGDGLSNLTEYLISRVFGFADISAFSKTTSGIVNDYFRKQGHLYFGEIFQDHDQVDDAWENEYGKFANGGVYDPNRDDDDDGWGNYDEFMAGTHPGKQFNIGVDGLVSLEVPVPIIKLNLSYAGNRKLSGNTTVVALDKSGNYEAKWTLGSGASGSDTSEVSDSQYIGKKPSVSKEYHIGHNTIIEGTFKAAFKVLNYEIGSLEDGEFVFEKYGDPEDAEWIKNVADREGRLYDMKRNEEVGTIDYENGLITLDFASNLLSEYMTVESKTVTTNVVSGGTTNAIERICLTRMNMDESYVMFSWKEKAIPVNGKKEFYFSVADKNNQGSYDFLRKGKHEIFVFDDMNGNGHYDGGEPCGSISDADIGWNRCEITVIMEDVSTIQNACLNGTVTSDHGRTIERMIKDVVNETSLALAAQRSDALSVANLAKRFQIVSNLTDDDFRHGKMSVRFVRFAVNDIPAYLLGVGGPTPDPLVKTSYYTKDLRDFLCEADFLSDTEFDLDWARLDSEVSGKASVIRGAGNVTNMTYLAVLEGGEGHEYWIRGSSDTNTVIRALSTTIERRFEAEKHAPVAENVSGICYSARPTFRWSLPNEEAFAKKYGTSYTAFKLHIFLNDGSNYGRGTVIYDSGVRRAPAQDANGVFSWTADVSAGDLTKLGERLATSSNYFWRVAMFNAKFKPNDDDLWEGDRYSAEASFSFAVNTQQEMNDHQYSSIDVSVKYAGPAVVLDSSEDAEAAVKGSYTNLNSLVSKVRVQAFATADFAGEPLSETVVTTNVDNLASAVANARLIGLPATGTYYIRAYIDSNGNHERDEWESWGAAKEAVTLTTTTVVAPVVGVWIEDCDVDQDWLPDAWEYVKCGSLTNRIADVKDASKTIFTTDMATSAGVRLASLPNDLTGSTLTIFENGSWAKQLLGWGDSGGNITFDEINANTQHSVDLINNNFLVRSAVLNTNGVVLCVNSDIADGISGQMLNKYFFTTPAQSRTTTVKVYRKNSYVDAEWMPYNTVTTPISCTDRIKTIPINGISATNGIYKVVVE